MPSYDLTKYEQETLIRYNQEEDAAIIDTCDKKLIRKLDKLCEKISTITLKIKINMVKLINSRKNGLKSQPLDNYLRKQEKNWHKEQSLTS